MVPRFSRETACREINSKWEETVVRPFCLMKNLIVLVCLLAIVGCSNAGPQRAARPAFKGMELYSWKPAGKDWHFSLLVGTNRQKPLSMITAPGTEVVGVANLKKKLSHLAKGEQVFWRNMAKEPVPPNVVRDLTTFCSALDIKLEKL